MTTCHVLVQGRANDDSLGPTGTVGLVITDPSTVILIDAGDPWNGSEIIEKLKDHNVTSGQITHIVVTHGHLDHCANLGLFPEATVIMDWDVGKKSKENPRKTEYCVIPAWPYRISDCCKIMNLSGHTASDTIAIVQDIKMKRLVVYSGDLIEDSQDLPNFEINQLKLMEDEETELLSSQEFVFGSGDFIIPGHGAPFENPERILFLFFSFWRRFMIV
ncbi:hypothetical protein GCK72_008147 [Caenorhabditis remanei]|uniref:Metallo-beta-lactamase domain-containing protein n=1 Tax=Caenorhabditis remanei TaxID=31234 RepID=A0A6A5HKX8_CAERE|nr:hypothetical protein GCK72_008147 [Caenorhabditis remanei]KAF1768185.1 hypothetical protein GCK72_008147 [Caenorhabditis remanei]